MLIAPAGAYAARRVDLLRILSEKAPTPRALGLANEPPAAGASAVEQLMAALKESVEAGKAKQKQGRRPRSEKAG